MAFMRVAIKLLVVYIVVLSALAFLLWCFSPEPDWFYTGQLHAVITDADRIVVHNTDYHDDPETIDAPDVLFETRDPRELGAVRRNLVFEKGQDAIRCACVGYPAIDWYRGETQVATTSVQHGRAIRWYEVPGDAELTDESEKWLVQWLVSNGVPKSELSLGPDRSSSRRRAVIFVLVFAALILAGGYAVYKLARQSLETSGSISANPQCDDPGTQTPL